MAENAIRMLYGARIMLRFLPTPPQMLLSAPHVAITAPHRSKTAPYSTITAPHDMKTALHSDNNKIRSQKSVPKKKSGTLLLFLITQLLQLRVS